MRMLAPRFCLQISPGKSDYSGRTMATESQIQKVMSNLSEVQACANCGTRIRFGDLECPHCGGDLEDYLRQWAEGLINHLELE